MTDLDKTQSERDDVVDSYSKLMDLVARQRFSALLLLNSAQIEICYLSLLKSK